MKTTSILVSGAFALAMAVAFAPTQVQAASCLEGAAVGGAAGHLMGHHTLLGAGAGCLIGRHEENRDAHGAAYRNDREDRYDRQDRRW
jgi:hypothetical protein